MTSNKANDTESIAVTGKVAHEIAKRLATKLKSFSGPRTGFQFWQLEVPNWRSVPMQFSTGPVAIPHGITSAVISASSYWGDREIASLQKHLTLPASPFTFIAGWNDDGWVSSEDPETIYYVTGIDFYDCRCGDPDDRAYISWTKTPARLLYNYLLDQQEAWAHFDGSIENSTKPRTGDFHEEAPQIRDDYAMTWKNPGDYAAAITLGKEYQIPDDHISQYDTALGAQDQTTLRLLSLPKSYSLYDRKLGNTEVYTIPRVMLNAYCANIPGWPKDLPPGSLFHLFVPEISSLGIPEWLTQMGIPDWNVSTKNMNRVDLFEHAL